MTWKGFMSRSFPLVYVHVFKRIFQQNYRNRLTRFVRARNWRACISLRPLKRSLTSSFERAMLERFLIYLWFCALVLWVRSLLRLFRLRERFFMTRWKGSFGVSKFRVRGRHTSVRFNSVFIYIH